MRKNLLLQIAALVLAADSAQRMAREAPQYITKCEPSPMPASPKQYNQHEARNARREQIRRNGGKR